MLRMKDVVQAYLKVKGRYEELDRWKKYYTPFRKMVENLLEALPEDERELVKKKTGWR